MEISIDFDDSIIEDKQTDFTRISGILLIVPECDYFTFNATCEFREEYSFCIHMRKISNLSVLCDNPPIWPNGFFVGFLNGHMLDFYAGGKGRILAKSNVTIEDIFDEEWLRLVRQAHSRTREGNDYGNHQTWESKESKAEMPGVRL